MTYRDFIASKTQLDGTFGFEPVFVPDWLMDFQRHLVEWSVRRGRAAMFADCGMGKTPMQLVWAENVVRKTNGRVLILTPLAVASQTVREGEKFGIECEQSRDGSYSSKIVVTNYEKLDKFDANDFEGVVCDESSILKNFKGKTKGAVTEFMRLRPYRLLCTATAAPNDFVELGTSSEALGQLGWQDMVSKFFVQETSKDHLGWGRTKYRLRRHAQRDFWRWVTSWSRSCRKPSDLGFDDGQLTLPPLNVTEHVVAASQKRPGVLFDTPARDLHEQREERRRTIGDRCAKAAELTNGAASVAWCYLNDEGDELERLIPGAVQVSGADSDDVKEERFEAFASGEIRVLVTKPSIGGFGLNWQHCRHQTFFPSHSFEQWYQSVRRCWRFGQTGEVAVDVVASEGEAGVLANLKRKAAAAEEMFAMLVRLANESLSIVRGTEFSQEEEVPAWLSPINA